MASTSSLLTPCLLKSNSSGQPLYLSVMTRYFLPMYENKSAAMALPGLVGIVSFS